MEQTENTPLFSKPENLGSGVEYPFAVFDFRIDTKYLAEGNNPLNLPLAPLEQGEYFADIICNEPGYEARKVYVIAYPTLGGIRLVGNSEDYPKFHEHSQKITRRVRSELTKNGYQIEDSFQRYIW